jgi:tetratricopeptide (TPR) repeat protein
MIRFFNSTKTTSRGSTLAANKVITKSTTQVRPFFIKPFFLTNSEIEEKHNRLINEIESHLQSAETELSNRHAMRALEHYEVINKLFDEVDPSLLHLNQKISVARAYAKAADIVYHSSSKDHVALEFLQKALHLDPDFDEASKLRKAILLERNEYPGTEH